MTAKAHLVKYILAGMLSFVADYGVLLLLYRLLGVSLEVATIVAFFTGLIVNFTLNRYWVFEARHGGKKHFFLQSVMYGALVTFNLLATTIIIAFGNSHGVGPEVLKPFTTALITLWNFSLYKIAIFRPAEPN